ncbi:MAG TPA: prolyl oligopeptidase family serine peptidase [Thermoanaerobaculia bacterium]|jgi:prolyl oligopeptidase|nr:prolyl oligopeptidase family serine peptidase [Thermoanaerobaculia bacterium]
MSRKLISLICLLVVLPSLAAAGPLHYPETPKVDQKDTYHGVTVEDPYRWLEQDVRQSDEVRKWVEAENRVTFDYLAAIPEREAIEKRLTRIWNFETRSVPVKAGRRYFYTRNDGLQNQAVLYTQTSLDVPPTPADVLIDPNTWSQDGTVALVDFKPSLDGRLAVYGVREAGSDWRTWHVLDLETRKLLPDELKWIKTCCAVWTSDGLGFFYTHLPEPRAGTEFQRIDADSKVYYHRVGTPQADDVLVDEDPEHPEWESQPEVTADGRYLVLSTSNEKGKLFRILVRDLAEPYAMTRPLVPSFDNGYFNLVANRGPVLYFHTDAGAPRGRLIAIDLRDPRPESWKEIIPESGPTLSVVSRVGDLLVAGYMKDAADQVRVFTLDGQPVRDVELPGIGSIKGFQGRPEDTETFYQFSSFANPGSTYRYDLATGRSTLLFRPEVDFDPAGFEVKQVFFPSRDGTRIPMFLTYRKGLKLDGNNPTLLTGYGGFNIPQNPTYSSMWITWMEMGGVYALVNLRGGNEYGEEWHAAGTKLRKQNVFDDFIAAAEWLIANRYTRSSRLGIRGGSNGGLLVGAAMTQRPDLFGAALPAVGVMDMLRFHRFTVGRYWVDDYGSSDDPEQFKALYAYSPYHNLKPGTKYPATLVTTADTDDRVVPGHSFKFAARLQEDQAGAAPVLIRIESRAGHGGSTPTSKLIERSADELAFLVRSLGMETGAARSAP